MSDDGPLTVGKLREFLGFLDDGLLVVLSRDAEGNGFSPLSEVDHDASTGYIADSTWSGNVPHPDDYEAGDGVECVVLWPTN